MIISLIIYQLGLVQCNFGYGECFLEKIRTYHPSSMGRLREAIFKSAEAVHLTLLCHFGEAIKCALSDENTMAARNRPLPSSCYV